MLFRFLKYTQPTNYFSNLRSDGTTIFPQPDKLPAAVKEQLTADDHYQSELAKNYDLSWQAIQKGVIEPVETIDKIEPLSLKDEYRFIRKYFHSFWSIYCLVLRISTFHNPIKEFRAWNFTKGVKRVTKPLPHVYLQKWESFESELTKSNPKISVIIPTLNRYEHLKNVLTDFEQQDYSNFELIVIDQSTNFNEQFYKEFQLEIKVVRQEEKALWLARNTGIRQAKGTFIALSEDDVRIQNNWLSQHLKCIDFFKAAISTGVFYPKGTILNMEKKSFTIAQQFSTGNAMLYRDVFLKTGLFDRQFEKQRMGDGEFGMRCYTLNIKSISNPKASCVDLKAPKGGLRELGSWDAFRPTKLFAPRPIPSVLYYYRSYFGRKKALLTLIKAIPPSVIPYKFKRNKVLLMIGFIIALIFIPILLIQVIASWQLAAKKIKQGPRIDEL